jgi:hypothetical protein
MKNLLLLLLSAILFLTSCTVKLTPRSPGHIPPGQAKKIAGSQSAKPYAPGQQKH